MIEKPHCRNSQQITNYQKTPANQKETLNDHSGIIARKIVTLGDDTMITVLLEHIRKAKEQMRENKREK